MSESGQLVSGVGFMQGGHESSKQARRELAALMAKMDKQSEQLENLTRQQSERVDGMVT